MTDEPRPGQQGTGSVEQPSPEPSETESTSEPATGTATLEGPPRIEQTVELRDIGPCKKHVKVTIPAEEIKKRLQEKFGKLAREANIRGFRPGKAPLALIQRRYAKEVNTELKGEILMASLEQMAEEQQLAAISPPNLDPTRLELPTDGDFIYEFEVEVRPEFELPEYKGLKLKRYTRTFTDEDIDREQRRILQNYGQVIPKTEGGAEIGDVLVADVAFLHNGKELSSSKEIQLRVEKVLAFRDGVARNFAEQVRGARAGDRKTVDVELSVQAANPELRGTTVQMILDVKDLKTVRLPELTEEFLSDFGVKTPEQFRELVHSLLQRRLEYEQRQSFRQQILQHFAAAADWQLPEDLVLRQTRKALNRRIMEMRADGLSEEEIRGRLRLVEQDILRNTALDLKVHFVLQKIAEVEKIEPSDDDIELEIERIAERNNESPRKLRARLEREDMLDSLVIDMVEREVLDLIVEKAEIEDVAVDRPSEEGAVSTVEEQAVPGTMRNLEAEGTAAQAAAESPPAEPQG